MRTRFFLMLFLLAIAVGVTAQMGYFLDIANVDTDACSEGGSLVAHCYNPELPPPPSIVRPIRTANDKDPFVIATPHGEVKPGKIHVLPEYRSSNDGRLLLIDPRSKLQVFRPENIGYDYQQRGDDDDFGYAELVRSNKQSIHKVSYFRPDMTSLDLWGNVSSNGTIFAPPIYHDSICDDSSDADDLDTVASTGRNPRSCRARLVSGAPLADGDCYDISMWWRPLWTTATARCGSCARTSTRSSSPRRNSPTSPPPRRALSKRWRELIYRLYEIDALTCNQCGGEMKILAFVTEPNSIRKTLNHRDETAAEPRAPPPPTTSD